MYFYNVPYVTLMFRVHFFTAHNFHSFERPCAKAENSLNVSKLETDSLSFLVRRYV